ncbi:hypothetical protein ASE12_08590 [Aeromicrobium sp. Root236]|uniref:hypothetical protein n=1 Tax=Aeromicrobium sp. Root236 TaxID=1736498 RepID=UPI0006F7075F|nr:hypothetical protein [Aeromicrobium sp. Root236]KRC64822.1 hypothetical protein ASE12_08590 [Aeromicrobium sp. Root236]
MSPGYPPPYYVPPKHPQATTAMVLGILGIAACGILAPIAWSIGGKAIKEIEANPGLYSGQGEANAGRILGIVGTCIFGFTILAMIGLLSLSLTSA